MAVFSFDYKVSLRCHSFNWMLIPLLTLILSGLLVAEQRPQQVTSHGLKQPPRTKSLRTPPVSKPTLKTSSVPHGDEIAAQSSLAPQANPTKFGPGLGLTGFACALLLSSLLAGMRLKEKFRHFSGLGVLGNGYAWCFVGFMALLSGISYLGLSELQSVLTKTLENFSLGFKSVLAIGGGGGGGHALVALGRLAPRSHPNPVPPGQNPGWQMSNNVILMFFYNGIYDHIIERMHTETEGMANGFDWKTVQISTCQLLQDEITGGRLAEDEGQKEIAKIKTLSSNADEDYNNKYLALSWTIGKSSFSQIKSRLSRTRAGMSS